MIGEENARNGRKKEMAAARKSGCANVCWDMKKRELAVVILIALVLTAGGVFACFFYDAPQIAFGQASYDDLVVEYGEKIPYHSISAVYKSKVFHRGGVPLAVESASLAEPVRPGEYTIRYEAAYRELTAEGSYRVRVVDTVPPEITVEEKTYTFSCRDNVDGDITDAVAVEEHGAQVTLRAVDSSGNTAEATFVRDVVPPVITPGNGLLDYTCFDETDGDITDRVQYYESDGTMYYTAADDHGNIAEASKRITGSDRVVYLTFDDGPGPCTEQLLDILKKYGVRATFFVVGSSDCIDLLPRIAAEGHSVGAHAYRHNYGKVYASDEAYFEDLALVQQAIAERIGTQTKLIRFPGGSSNTVSRSHSQGIMTRLTREVTERGYTYFDWNVSSGDAGATTLTQEVIANVENGILRHNVSVVLQHDVKDFSVAGVEEIIRWGKANGCVFCRLPSDPPRRITASTTERKRRFARAGRLFS